MFPTVLEKVSKRALVNLRKTFKIVLLRVFFLDGNVSYFENICETVLFDTSFEFIFLLLVVSLISSPFLFTLYCFLHLVRRCLVTRVI